MNKFIDYVSFDKIEDDVSSIIDNYINQNFNNDVLKNISKNRLFWLSKGLLIVLSILGLVLLVGGFTLIAFLTNAGMIVLCVILIILGLISYGIVIWSAVINRRLSKSICKNIRTKEALKAIFNNYQQLQWINLDETKLEGTLNERQCINWIHDTGWYDGWYYDETLEFDNVFGGAINNNPFDAISLKLQVYRIVCDRNGCHKQTRSDQYVLLEVDTNILWDCNLSITHKASPFKENLKKEELENEKFNKEFALYTNDSIGIRMLLTPLAQENLTKLLGEKVVKHIAFYKYNGRILIMLKAKYGSFGRLKKFWFVDHIKKNMFKALLLQTQTLYIVGQFLNAFPLIQAEEFKKEQSTDFLKMNQFIDNKVIDKGDADKSKKKWFEFNKTI